MKCFEGCFRGIRKSCSRFRARFRRKTANGRVAPTVANDEATYDPTKERTQTTVASVMTAEEPGASDREITTPEALNQVVDEFVAYEVEKIRALSLIKNDKLADDLIYRNATLHQILRIISKGYNHNKGQKPPREITKPG